MPSSASSSNEQAPKRGRGRPRRIYQLRVEPVARRTIDIHRIVKLLVGLTLAESGRKPPDRPDTGGRP